MKRNQIILGVVLLLIIAAVLFLWFRSASDRPRSLPEGLPLELNQKPVYDWYVCEDLGIGPVPGVSDPRQRFRVCHNEGWEVLAYCLQPNWPAPDVGAACALIDENTFWCGFGLQNLREYSVLQTPTPTPTPLVPTATPTSSPTATSTALAATETPSTPLPSATSTPGGPSETATLTPPAASPTPLSTSPAATPPGRPSPGGSGFVEWLLSAVLQSGATPTPFLPQLNTPVLPAPQVAGDTGQGSAHPASSATFYGIDFNDTTQRIRIKIFPPNERVNQGKPIVIAFTPGQTCEYGDRQACINRYVADEGGEVIYVTAHSGINGEAEAFRRAVEGMGFDQASSSLRKVHARLQDLQGAQVEIVQGETVVSGLVLAVASRVPPTEMLKYLDLGLPEALDLASANDPLLASSLRPDQPQIVFETCGWKMPGEPWLPGITSTNASIYLGLIQKIP